ncbi:oxysterol binding protein-like protein [Dothidotthia symphoricarpi CBS 119687]|uniref:Oxysterol binding protein-like protein n=1 Tax=Dothidotthia symphoricarpi CBS 119687 TaxID=1392245 RepID=A0A6A6AEN7_9PLEO|nr:oxysterol binding protein-like protein [Dothidotthia symphoricarpi CBS 119687]KAF2130280.1 oxysterol binding protein-like protein [Dothidotthia symphoricarpi CBS 119687]
MAGMENIEVHSKSYLVRWVNVSAGHSISWSLQPHKKSVNFGIFKHPGAGTVPTPSLTSSATFDSQAPGLEVPAPTRGRGLSTSRNEKTFVLEKLSAIGLKQVHWQGKCEADQVSMGTYDVPQGEGGMYGLVFDNTFSKTVSKTATFVLMTYPTNAAPKSGHHMHYAQALAGQSTTSLTRSSPSMGPLDSSESLAQTLAERPKSVSRPHGASLSSNSFLTGVLQKKRRKRNQGYARRFFSLDFTSSTLSYYRNDRSSALRGAVPLSLAAIGANEDTREISVDSGAEIWQLRANNAKDFDMWKDALDRASRTAGAMASPTVQIKDSPYQNIAHVVNAAEDNEWARVEALLGRVSGTRDAVRRLAQDTDPKYNAPAGLGTNSRVNDSLSPTPSDMEATEYFPDNAAPEKKAFWKRKASTSGPQSPAGIFKRTGTMQMGVASSGTVPPVPPLPANLPANGNARRSVAPQSQEGGVHDNCMALLRDLDSVVKEFSGLIAESKQRRSAVPPPATSSRHSIDSQDSGDEFFDAHDGAGSKSQLLTIRRDSEDAERKREEEQIDDDDDDSDGESESSSEPGETGVVDRARMSREATPALFPTKPTSLSPLPLSPVKRRSNIEAPKTLPPSLIAFFRKNVGKDLSTIAMPVSANEPTSALQRIAEQLEYSELLDAAATAAPETGERLVYMAAFAISYFSNTRVKDRAIRKPFNPMLGETFELVREDKGFRFIAEKVLHRPVRMACQAEADQWTFIQSPTPVQKFWGKSAELNTEGRVRVFLHASGEHYSWTIATSYLRNVIAGEKYLEPSGTMSITNETTGAKALCTFKAGGMFAGRSEEVSVQVSDATGAILPMGATGKWTSDLQLTSNGQPTGTTVWKAGPLVDKAEKHYGLTSFAAALNQITSIEDGRMAATDSRLRPDQRALEDGDLDKAEALKARLEERQRARRKVLEDQGEEWKPRWFTRLGVEEAAALGDDEVWRLRGGREGYWECRERGEWEGVGDVFQT